VPYLRRAAPAKAESVPRKPVRPASVDGHATPSLAASPLGGCFVREAAQRTNAMYVRSFCAGSHATSITCTPLQQPLRAKAEAKVRRPAEGVSQRPTGAWQRAGVDRARAADPMLACRARSACLARW
jgi:hypothetical protein